MSSKVIIRRMEKRGYFFDEINSEKGMLKFSYVGAFFPLIFSTWGQVEKWEKETRDY